MKKFFLIIFIFYFSIETRSDELLHTFEQANEAFRKGDYKTAVTLYERIYSNGFESPELFYNLGNAYFKLQNIPASLLWYERAHRLSPGDDDIIYNMRLANLRVVDKIEPLPKLFFIEWGETIVNLFSSDTWAIIFLILIWCSLILASMFLLSRTLVLRRLFFFLTVVFLVVGIFVCGACWLRFNSENETNHAIVFVQVIPIKSAPDNQSTDLFVLHEGVKVEIIDTVGEWKKIRLADGKVGWILQEHLQII